MNQPVLDTLIERFCQVAPAEIARFFPTPNNCIAAVRIMQQVFLPLGVDVRPHPCRFLCQAPALERMYIASPHDEAWERSVRDRVAVTSEEDRRKGGWQGHLVALVGGWLVDLTWLAAAPFLGAEWFEGADPVLALQLPAAFDQEMCVRADCVTPRGLSVEVRYEPVADNGYLETPAWELDHLEPAIALISRRMAGGEPQKFFQFVVYRRPRDMPFASIVVRRWQLTDEGEMIADENPVLVLSGSEEKALAFARERLRSKGLIRWERLLEDDPVIVEVWF
jgi:hypothetical protein